MKSLIMSDGMKLIPELPNMRQFHRKLIQKAGVG